MQKAMAVLGSADLSALHTGGVQHAGAGGGGEVTKRGERFK